nr:hypothetical protein [Oscillochloris sp. ZM17-4]
MQNAAPPLLIYLTLAVLLTWPTALRLTTAVPGNAYDSWQNMWNFWWLRKALLAGDNPYFTPMLYYPQGASLLLQTLNPLNFLVSLPVHALLGLVAAYNFVVIFSLTMGGLCTYALARDVGALRPAALVGGVVFATSGYLLAQVMGGHTHMMAAWPLPLAVLALRRAQARVTPWRVTLAGLSIVLSLLSDWQYLLFALIWAGWYALAQIFRRRDVRAALPAIAAVALALVLISPLIIATARASAGVPTAASEGGPDFRREQSVDVADLAIPSQLHPLWGLAAERLQSYKATTHIQNKTAYLGLVTVLLAALALRRRKGRFWLISAIVFIILAMGPTLQVAGWQSGLPLPGGLLFELPLIRIFRYPVRFMALAMLSLAVLSALGTQRLLAMIRHRRSGGAWAFARRRPRLVAALLVGLIVIDNLTIPFPMAAVYIPQIYAEMAADHEQYAVLEAPFYYFSSSVYMLYQVVHDKPLVGGYTSRRLPYALLDELPIVRMLAFAAPAPDIVGQDMERIAPSVFSYFNIRYVMLHSTGGALRYSMMMRVASAAAGGAPPRREVSSVVASDSASASGLRRSFWVQSEEAAGAVLAYKVVEPASPVPFLGVGSGWGDPMAADDGGVTRTAAGASGLTLYSALAHEATLSLDIVAATPGPLSISADGALLAQVDLEGGRQQVQISLHVRPGETLIRLSPASGSLTLAHAAIQ